MFEISKKIISKKEKYIFPAINFRPIVINGGEGTYVNTVDGNKILDMNSGQFCNIFGYSNRNLFDEIYSESKTLINTSTACLSKATIEAAEEIYNICPGLNAQTLMLSTGSEAVEAALRYAKFLKNKNGIACLDKNYHGLTLGSQSVTLGGKYSRPQVHEVYVVPTPENNKESEDQALEVIKSLFLRDKDKISAFILEPIISVGGMIFLSEYFIAELRNLCSEFDVLLIFDECQTCFGRTGEWFYYQKLNVIPDILIAAKGLGSGFPVSAVIFNSKTINSNDIDITNYSSHQNDPFSAIVIKVGIKYIKKQGLLKKVKNTGVYFLDSLKKLEEENASITNARGCGLMIGLDLELKTKNYRKTNKKILDTLLEEGVMLQSTSQGKVFRILPAYVIKRKEIDFFVEKMNMTLNKLGLK